MRIPNSLFARLLSMPWFQHAPKPICSPGLMFLKNCFKKSNLQLEQQFHVVWRQSVLPGGSRTVSMWQVEAYLFIYQRLQRGVEQHTFATSGTHYLWWFIKNQLKGWKRKRLSFLDETWLSTFTVCSRGSIVERKSIESQVMLDVQFYNEKVVQKMVYFRTATLLRVGSMVNSSRCSEFPKTH